MAGCKAKIDLVAGAHCASPVSNCESISFLRTVTLIVTVRAHITCHQHPMQSSFYIFLCDQGALKPKMAICFHIHMQFTFWYMCRHYMCVCVNTHAHVCIGCGCSWREGRPCSEAGVWRLVGLQSQHIHKSGLSGSCQRLHNEGHYSGRVSKLLSQGPVPGNHTHSAPC